MKHLSLVSFSSDDPEQDLGCFNLQLGTCKLHWIKGRGTFDGVFIIMGGQKKLLLMFARSYQLTAFWNVVKYSILGKVAIDTRNQSQVASSGVSVPVNKCSSKQGTNCYVRKEITQRAVLGNMLLLKNLLRATTTICTTHFFYR